MFIIFILGLIAVFLTRLSQDRQNGSGLKAAFCFIFVFLALRYDYGNDYMTYLEHFKDLGSYYDRRTVDVSEMWWEPGWVLLNLFFYPVGFFTMVMFTSLLTCVVTYRFIRNFVPAPYQWLAVFLYVFNPYQILVPASAMRQNMAILLFLVGFEFLCKKRLLGYFLLVVAGWSFHKSAMVLIPIAALAFVNIRINKFFAVLCVLMYVSLYLFGEQVFGVITSVSGVWFEKYKAYEGTGGVSLNLGLGLAYAIFLFVNVLYFAGVEFIRSEEVDNDGVLPGQFELFANPAARRLLFKLAILTFMFTPLAFQMQMVSRINMYFTPLMIAVYPIIASAIRDRLYRLMFLGSLISFILYIFVNFFRSSTWQKGFGTYQTILSLLDWW